MTPVADVASLYIYFTVECAWCHTWRIVTHVTGDVAVKAGAVACVTLAVS